MEPSFPLTQRLVAALSAGAGEPIAHQIAERVWLAAVDGTLETGDRLPTARQLAIALNVSPRLVERAYHQLEERGVIATRPGEGTFVSLRPTDSAEWRRHRELQALCRETVTKARDLGFDVDDLVDALGDYRGSAPGGSGQEEGS